HTRFSRDWSSDVCSSDLAGTYTPFALVNLRGAWGWSLLAVVWGIAFIGVVLELAMRERKRWLSISLYLGLGWLAIVVIKPMIANVDRKSTRLNSSHVKISYAVFCLKK